MKPPSEPRSLEEPLPGELGAGFALRQAQRPEQRRGTKPATEDAPKIRSLLQSARRKLTQAGCDTPALDAELLAAHLLGVDRARLLMEAEKTLSASQQEEFRQLIARRGRREPLPYILGEWEFFGLTLEVSPAVLIPRPETETLVEVCLSHLSPLTSPLATPGRGTLLGVEVGCGSGAISIALAHHTPNLRIIATDTSQAALAVARRNCLRHNLADATLRSSDTSLRSTSHITLLHGDLLEPLAVVGRGLPASGLRSPSQGEVGCPPPAPAGRGLCSPPQEVDFIVANLPYIPTAQIASLPPEVRDWEPRQAIDGGPDGLSIIRRLIEDAPRWLRKGGFLALEISPEQADEIKRLLSAENFRQCEVVPDLSGRARVAIGCH